MKTYDWEIHPDNYLKDIEGSFVFKQDEVVFRQVNQVYKKNYDHLMESGLYKVLVKKGLLVPHQEVSVTPPEPERSYLCLKPEQIPFISYPYEWSFSQLKDAALATLSIQKRALKLDMSLKDASAYNIQFVHGNIIDILFDE